MSKLSIIGLIMIIGLVFLLANWRSAGITSSGSVITQDRTIRSFTKLKLDGVFKTIITQDGGEASIKVEADNNLQKIITTKNDGETLNIAMRENLNLNNPGKMIVYVNVRDINSIITSSVGNLENKGVLKSPSLYLKSDAVGKTNLNIETDKLNADLSSVGAVTLSGHATRAEIDNNSVGKLNAFELRTETLILKNKAVGAAEVCANKELDIDHEGVGAVHYKGDPAVKNLKDNGVGKVCKAD